MPQLLDSAYDPGEIDPGKSYTHFKVLDMMLSFRNPPSLRYVGVYGYLDSGVFVAGRAPEIDVIVADSPKGAATEYTDMVVANISAYTAIKTAIYADAAQRFSRLVGTLE